MVLLVPTLQALPGQAILRMWPLYGPGRASIIHTWMLSLLQQSLVISS